MDVTAGIPVPVVLIDDEQEALQTESLALTINGFKSVLAFNDAAEAIGKIRELQSAVVLLDITMPRMDGMQALELITRDTPEAAVIMLTGLNDVETAVRCIKSGALDYIVKPVDQTRLVTSVRKAMEHLNLKTEARLLGEAVLAQELRRPEAFSEIVTGGDRLSKLFAYIEAIAPTGLPVLITGETGVGKELFARAVHRASARTGEFICVNTAGIDDTLFSDTLFGHLAGAFTGAQKDRAGLIERAAGGTLFLDEIGDISPESQIKLLRLLQDGTYYPLGSETECTSAARVVTATNRSLAQLQTGPGFRKDLFYRLKSHHVQIPPLRERPEDIAALADHFIGQAARQQGKPRPSYPAELVTVLLNYDFPGNVRELQGILFDAVSRHKGGGCSRASRSRPPWVTAQARRAAKRRRHPPCGFRRRCRSRGSWSWPWSANLYNGQKATGSSPRK